jgi:hypothetical protein
VLSPINEKPKLLAVSSPAPPPVKRLDFNRIQKNSKLLSNQQLDKDKLKERLLKEQVLNKNKSEARTVIKNHEGNLILKYK